MGAELVPYQGQFNARRIGATATPHTPVPREATLRRGGRTPSSAARAPGLKYDSLRFGPASEFQITDSTLKNRVDRPDT
jgi:hypothetical protein